MRILLLLCLQGALGISQRGHHPWTVILCKFFDNPAEPQSPEWFRSWMTDERLPGSIKRFFDHTSNGLYNISGSNVVGWLRLAYTKADVAELGRRDVFLRKLRDPQLQLYYKTKELCLTAGRRLRGATIHANVISVVNSENTAVFCRESGVLLTPKFFLSSALAHEMTHSLNIGHSYSDASVRVFPYSEPGEYDDKYDLMSTANAYMHKASFGMTGPGLNGPHLDFLGWLPANRLLYFGEKRRREAIVRLGSLSVPHAQSRGYLLLYIPYDRDDPTNVYTVEYRTPHESDRGINRGAVVIHKLSKKEKGYRFSYLVTHGTRYYELIRGTEWSHTFPVSSTHGTMFIRIRFLRNSDSFNSADVHVISTFDPSACIGDEVVRATTEDDSVCVTPTRLSTIRNQKATLDSFGRCSSGFVPRSAIAGDKGCVSKPASADIDAENGVWHRRSRFFDGLATFGLNRCRDPSHVWRLIDEADYACVPPNRAVAAQSHNTTGACRGGLMKRAAFDGDGVCVSRAEARFTREENGLQPVRLSYYSFFNGIDEVTVPSHHTSQIIS